jgi:uncharacterized protein
MVERPFPLFLFVPKMRLFAFTKSSGLVAIFLLFSFSPSAGQTTSRVSRCLSIQNINERVDCLEGTRPSSEPLQPPSDVQYGHVQPSFNCRLATHSIERAICSDPTLSEWDARMGQQYQQALSVRRPPEAQSLLEQQRSWIQKRNATCGAVAGDVVWSCVLELTKQRISVLSASPPPPAEPLPTALPTASPLAPPVQALAKSQPAQGIPNPIQPSTSPTPSAPSTDSNSPTPSKDTNSTSTSPLLVIIFLIGATVGGISVFNNVQHRARRQQLAAKYGEQIADMIMAREVWQGMTEEQLVESRGAPVDRDYEIKKTKTKQTWKYGQTGKNRFSFRVYLENGLVIGWKE